MIFNYLVTFLVGFSVGFIFTWFLGAYLRRTESRVQPYQELPEAPDNGITVAPPKRKRATADENAIKRDHIRIKNENP